LLERLEFEMPEYRIYAVVDDENSYLGSCRIIQSSHDNEAIRAAKRFLDFHELQIWEQSRLVGISLGWWLDVVASPRQNGYMETHCVAEEAGRCEPVCGGPDSPVTTC
jgi:hypothetical protein